MQISRPVSLTVWTLWHCVAAVTLALVPSQLRTGKSFWSLDAEHSTFLIGLAATYLLSIFALTVLIQRRKGIALTEMIVVVFAVFGGYFLYLLITESFYSRTLLAAAVMLSAVFIALSFSLKTRIQTVVLAIIAVLTLSLQALGSKPTEYLTEVLDLGPKPQTSKKVLNTMLYSVSSLTFSHYFDVCATENGRCRKPGTGGGISRFDGGFLLATGEGLLHFFELDPDTETLRTKPLPLRVPINTDSYESSVGENILNTFRVTDILVQDKGADFVLLVAHHFWKADDSCGVLRVSKVESEYSEFLSGNGNIQWQTLYETQPCLPATGGHLTRGSESGGKMVLVDNDTLLLTVGDHQYDGVDRTPVMAQDATTDYGKTLLIDLRTGSSQLYSLGHRNPQGLYKDVNGVVWSTEHGPRGGDELNIIVEGANYGWPLVTHGTQYGMHIWPVSTNQGRHDGFELPIFAWVPSIAVSNLISVQRELFPLWRGDLLIASFKKTLYRARVRDGRVVYLETIPIRGRIRDLLEDDEGRFVLYLDSGAVVFLRPIAEGYGVQFGKQGVTEDMRGELIFANCSGCHQIADGNSHGIGPDLARIVGRPIAESQGYSYSNALAKLEGKWTEKRLDEYLTSPQRFAAGTSMVFEGIADPADRAALIRYLKTPN